MLDVILLGLGYCFLEDVVCVLINFNQDNLVPQDRHIQSVEYNSLLFFKYLFFKNTKKRQQIFRCNNWEINAHFKLNIIQAWQKKVYLIFNFSTDFLQILFFLFGKWQFSWDRVSFRDEGSLLLLGQHQDPGLGNLKNIHQLYISICASLCAHACMSVCLSLSLPPS